VSASDREVLRNLERNLKLVIFGQDRRSRRWPRRSRWRARAWQAGDKPIGAFLFAGPTGVGKTEVTRQLRSLLGIELIRFDMSEYMERTRCRA
jgi:ATP-dependent Clp protease ATP-binding subunit ClpA